MKRIRILLSLFLLILSSCYTIKPIAEVMDNWIGSSENQITLKFGSPTKTSSDGKGGKILSYIYSKATSVYNPYSAVPMTNTYDNSSYIEFFIDPTDKVYYWRTNYPDEKIRDKKKTNIATGTFFFILLSGMFAFIISK